MFCVSLQAKVYLWPALIIVSWLWGGRLGWGRRMAKHGRKMGRQGQGKLNKGRIARSPRWLRLVRMYEVGR